MRNCKRVDFSLQWLEIECDDDCGVFDESVCKVTLHDYLKWLEVHDLRESLRTIQEEPIA